MIAFILSTLLALAPVNAQASDNAAFQGGERLIFTVHYKWGPINADVCNATFSIDDASYDGEKCYKSRFYGKVSKKFEKLVKLLEDFQSYTTVDKGIPLYYSRDTREGNYTLTDECKVNWNSHKLEAKIVTSSAGDISRDIPFSSTPHDITSLIGALRNMDLASLRDGQTLTMNLYLAPDIFPINITKVGTETKEIKGFGTVSTIKVMVKSAPNPNAGDAQNLSLNLWFSNDANHIPVYLETKLKVGSIKGTLNSYSGLRHEFTALQK